MPYRVTFIPGDGIGPEVAWAARRCLDATGISFQWDERLAGESAIKQFNKRVKGTEKFWSQPTSEAILQLRADYLSDSAPLHSFWLRHQARQAGVNTYAHAI